MELKSTERAIWLSTLFHWWRRFSVFACLLLILFVLKWVGIIGDDLYNSIVYVAAVILFFFAMPVSLFLRLDHLANQLSSQSSMVLLLVALFYLGLNFTFLGLLQGHFRQWKSKRKQVDSEPKDNSGPSMLNGKPSSSSH